jgi:hypothetical protein
MPGDKNLRAQVERELLAAVNDAKDEFDRATAEFKEVLECSYGCDPGSSDGTLAKSQLNRAHFDRLEAYDHYRIALQRFTEFILTERASRDAGGTPPPE